MASFEKQIPSAWTPDETFGYLAMFSNASDWDPGVLDAERLDSGPIRPGSQFRLVVPFGGRRLELIYRVVTFSREDREIRLTAQTALLRVTDHIIVGPSRPVSGQTFVGYRAEANLRGPARLLDPLLARAFQTVAERAAAGLTAALAPDSPALPTDSPGLVSESSGPVSESSGRLGVVRAGLGVVRARPGVVRAGLGVVRARLGVVRARPGAVRAGLGVVRARLGVVRAGLGVVRARPGAAWPGPGAACPGPGSVRAVRARSVVRTAHPAASAPARLAAGAMSPLAKLADSVLEASIVGSFSRFGFAVRSRLLAEFTAPLPSMAGRTVLITGATSGIGLAAACELAQLGAQVSFLARDRVRAERARHQITAAAALAGHDEADVQYGLADLEDLDSVKAFAAKYAASVPRLDVLIHNAGAINDRLATTPDGIELTVAGQLVAPFVLTELLLDRLRAAAPARVITISSGGMYSKRIDLDGLTATSPAAYSGAARYALVKRAQVALSTQWAARTDPSVIAFHALHPGWVRTPGLSRSLPKFSRLLRPLLRTPEQGADTVVFLAAADRRSLGSGRFWHDRRPRAAYRRPGPSPDPPGTGQALWDWTAELASRSAAAR